MRVVRYRVLRPLSVHGRIAATGEIVRLPEYAAAEFVEAGYLRAVDEDGGAIPINGSPAVWQDPR